MNKIYCLLIIALTSLIISGCLEQNPVSDQDNASEKAVLSGKILQQESDARIYLIQGRPVDSVSIDPADGYFSLKEIEPGTYFLKIAAAGFDTFTTSITVEPGYSYNFGNVLLAPLTENFEDSIPSIYDFWPSNGFEQVYLPPDKYNDGSERLFISVSFDRPMNRESVEEALSIEPEPEGGYFVWYQNTKTFGNKNTEPEYYWTGETIAADSYYVSGVVTDKSADNYIPSAEITTYSTAKSFTFYFPRSGCYTDTTYTIKISNSAVDTGGTPLDSALEYSFSTVQSAVSYNRIEMSPNNGEDWVNLISDNGIRLTFPKRMDESSVNENISINCEQSPVFLWQDFNHLKIYTGGFFIPDTTYTIIINGNAQDIDGNSLGENDTLSFMTEPIRVVGSSPPRAEIGVQVSANVVFTFNTYMDRSTFKNRLAMVSENNDTVDGNINNAYYTYNNNSDTTWHLNRILFSPDRNLLKNTLYTVYLSKGVKDLKGYSLKNDYKLEFITMP